MKKLKRLFSLGVIYTLVLIMAFSLVACGKKGKGETPETPPQPDPIVVTIGDAPSTIAEGETITLTVTVTGTDNTAVNWSVSDPTTLHVSEDGVVSVVTAPTGYDKNVVVTATSQEDPTKKDSVPLRVKAKTTEGQVGDLTSDAIAALGNASITAKGTVSDVYRDHYDSSRNKTSSYESEVKMQEDKWSGSWKVKDSDDAPITDTYMRGTEKVKYAEYDYYEMFQGYRDGYEILTEYIDKDNKVATKRVTDSMSAPAAWETNHLWNHLGSLDVNKFTYELDDLKTYTMEIDDNTSIEEQYLMAYLVVSLTPMLEGEDSFRSLTLVIDDNGNIVKLKGQSYITYQGAVYSQTGALTDWDAMSYTEVELDFVDVGSTTVASVTPYTPVTHADKLTAALTKMSNATSYYYEVTDTTTYAPDIDEGDYTIDSLSTSKTVGAKNAPVYCDVTIKNRTSATGTVGTRGWVTPEAILIETTGKYTASMDDKLYHLTYTGYRQFDGYYEEFAYDSTITDVNDDVVGGLKGTKHVVGNMMDKMPKFDFSSALFSCVEGIQSGKQVYIFTLKETAITRDIARQIATYYSDSAYPISGSPLTLTVDEDNNLISARYPYSLSGVYMGYCTIKFSGVGETTINMDKVDANFVERGWRESWDQYTVMYYDDIEYDNNGELVRTDSGYIKRTRDDNKNAQAAIDTIYGANKSDLPTAKDILDIFGDEFSGPFYDDREMERADGSIWLRRNLSLTLRSVVLDENGQVANFDELIAKCDEVFGARGFVRDWEQTDVSGGESGRYSRFVVWTTDKITIVLENNFTKNFWLEFYNAGEYNRAA